MSGASGAVLVLNAGSSSLKYQLVHPDTGDVRADGIVERIGFVSGYVRPDSPGTLMVWQVAVDADQRGHGLAGRMLDHLAEQVPDVTMLETTITDDNAASRALFARFARIRDAQHEETDLFVKAHFPDEGHDPEVLHRIGPF